MALGRQNNYNINYILQYISVRHYLNGLANLESHILRSDFMTMLPVLTNLEPCLSVQLHGQYSCIPVSLESRVDV